MFNKIKLNFYIYNSKYICTKKMELNYVKNIYEEIANHFEQTRKGYYWNSIKNFISSIPANSFILDCGCGNGKHMLLRNDCYFTGFDFCNNSMKICKNKNLEILINDVKLIPIRNNLFEYTLCVAVLHHLESKSNRIQAINELSRVTKLNGYIYIQVWSSDVKKNKKFIKINDNNDYFITWFVNKNKTIKRYYHLFEKEELINLCKECNLDICEIIYEFDNWIIIAKKTN